MRDYKLKEEELKQIKQAMTHAPEAEVRQRATAIHLLHQEHKPEEVGSMLAVSMGCIYKWHKRWREGGIAGLKNRARSGRPSKANESYCQELEEAMSKEPSDYGYGFAFWTVNRLREHLRQKTGVKLSNRRFRVLMKKQGYVYRRPKHDLTHLQDAEAVERAKELLEWVKKTPSADNSSLSLWTKQP